MSNKIKFLLSVAATMFTLCLGSVQAGDNSHWHVIGEADGLMWAISMRHGDFAQAAIQLQEKQIAMQDPRRSASERKAYLAGFDAGSAKLPHP
jgi:hypothetical protein